MDRVRDKIAIIAGAALGISRATALLLAKEGAKVAITDVCDAEGKDVAKQITSEGGVGEYWHTGCGARSGSANGVCRHLETIWAY